MKEYIRRLLLYLLKFDLSRCFFTNVYDGIAVFSERLSKANPFVPTNFSAVFSASSCEIVCVFQKCRLSVFNMLRERTVIYKWRIFVKRFFYVSQIVKYVWICRVCDCSALSCPWLWNAYFSVVNFCFYFRKGIFSVAAYSFIDERLSYSSCEISSPLIIDCEST